MATLDQMEKGEQGFLLNPVQNQTNLGGPAVLVAEQTVQPQKDCFLNSVVGYLLCPIFGMCAIYYAARTNYSVDLKAGQDVIDRHYTRAHLCTILSFVFGLIIIVTIGILLATDPEKLDSPIVLRLLRFYRP